MLFISFALSHDYSGSATLVFTFQSPLYFHSLHIGTPVIFISVSLTLNHIFFGLPIPVLHSKYIFLTTLTASVGQSLPFFKRYCLNSEKSEPILSHFLFHLFYEFHSFTLTFSYLLHSFSAPLFFITPAILYSVPQCRSYYRSIKLTF